jgi:TPR repeat protein
MTGFMLLQGQGTNKSVPLAIRFFEQAAAQNDASAQYVLGQIYTKGLGVKRNESQGRAWLEKAAENGNTAAQALLNN